MTFVLGTCDVDDVLHINSTIAAFRLRNVLTEESATDLLLQLEEQTFDVEDFGHDKRVGRMVVQQQSGLTDEVSKAFANPAFVQRLQDQIEGDPLPVRASTCYRMQVGDFIAPHNDRGNPFHDLSVAYNLTRGWAPGHGGETYVSTISESIRGAGEGSTWTLAPHGRAFEPQFNSALVLVLHDGFGHEVLPVSGPPRYSVTTVFTLS